MTVKCSNRWDPAAIVGILQHFCGGELEIRREGCETNVADLLMKHLDSKAKHEVLVELFDDESDFDLIRFAHAAGPGSWAERSWLILYDLSVAFAPVVG